MLAASVTASVPIAGCNSNEDSDQTATDTSTEIDPDQTVTDTSTEIPPSFTVEGLQAPKSVRVGDDITVTLSVTNDTDQASTYSGTLLVTGNPLSTEIPIEGALEGGENKTVEVAVLVPECEGTLSLEVMNESLSKRIEVNPFLTPRSEVSDYRYTEANTGMSEGQGPSSVPAATDEYANAISSTVRIQDETIAMVSGSVQVLDSDGTERWADERHSINTNTEPALFSDRLYVVIANNLLCYDVQTGEILWEFTEAGPPADQVTYTAMYGTPLVSDGAVYFNSMHGQVWAVNAYSGCKQWSQSLTPDGETHAISGTPTVKDDTLYIVGNDGVSTSDQGPLYALDKETGAVQWQSDEDILVGETTPVSENYVYARTRVRDGFSPTETVRAYNTADGTVAWETELDDLNTTPVVDENRVYLGRSWPTSNASGELVALDRENGDVDWRNETDAGIVNDPSIGANGVFITDWDDNLYSITPASGSVNWKTSDMVYRSDATIHEDSLYLVDKDSNIVTEYGNQI